jgi:proteic killer suppression protein
LRNAAAFDICQRRFDKSCVKYYLTKVIKSFRHKGLRRLWDDGDASGLPAQLLRRLQTRLVALNEAASPGEMNIAGFDFHELKGARRGVFTVHVNGPWCVTFRWDEGAVDVDFENYH